MDSDTDTMIGHFEQWRKKSKDKAQWVGVVFSGIGVLLSFTISPMFGTFLFAAGVVFLGLAIVL